MKSFSALFITLFALVAIASANPLIPTTWKNAIKGRFWSGLPTKTAPMGANDPFSITLDLSAARSYFKRREVAKAVSDFKIVAFFKRKRFGPDPTYTVTDLTVTPSSDGKTFTFTGTVPTKVVKDNDYTFNVAKEQLLGKKVMVKTGQFSLSATPQRSKNNLMASNDESGNFQQYPSQ